MADSDNSIQGYTDGVFWERSTLSDQKNTKESLLTKKLMKDRFFNIIPGAILRLR